MADVNITTSFPGEQIAVAILNFISERRAEMDPETRKRWDAMQLELAERMHKRLIKFLDLIDGDPNT